MTLQHHPRQHHPRQSRQASRLTPGPSPRPWGVGRAIAGLLRRAAVVLPLALAGTLLAQAQAPEVVFDFKIENGRVAERLRRVRVSQGDAVRLRWSTDRPIVLHLHGYDIETKVTPGAVAEMAFIARATGRFPVEEHKPDASGTHSHGEVPLVRLEVRPR
jgi:hypothetical protein